MKKVSMILLIISVLWGCTSEPSEGAIQTAIAKTEETKSEHVEGPNLEEGQNTPTPNIIPTETQAPTKSAEEWFFDEVDISSFYIFEAGENPDNAASRNYDYSFMQQEARVVYCEIELVHPGPEQEKTFTIEAVYYGPDGDEVYGHAKIQPLVNAGWTMSHWIVGYGWNDPGSWAAGLYRVDVLVGDQVIASENFDIIQQTPTPADTLTPTPRPGAIVDTASLNVRSGPDTVYSIVGSASKGETLDIVGQAYGCGWLKIRKSNGVEGWVSAELVDYQLPCSEIPAATIPPTPIPLPTSTPTTQAQQGKTVSVKIINNTGGTLTLNLSGPATYSFTFSAGTHTIQVVPGTYTYTAWGCGATASGSKKLTKSDEWTWYCQ